MKLLFTSLAVLLLYLSCIPCSDNDECNMKAEVRISSTAEHEQHNHDKESCSPFCTCSCCAASVFNSPMFKTSPAIIVSSSKKYLLFNVAVNNGVHHSVWQPPKLS